VLQGEDGGSEKRPTKFFQLILSYESKKRKTDEFRTILENG
jgi:hypothetical protein